jgi:protein-S-isoprenylcysteine O-methyltransferase Ste14
MKHAVEPTESKEKNSHPRHLVHSILAHSYLIYFLILIIGVTLDLVFPDKIFATAIMMPTGFMMLVLATIVILWAQHTSRKLDVANEVTKETFCKGPYCYTRTPTHWGLFLLILGFGFILNAFFVIVLTVISFIITKLFFLKKQEAVLEQKYGTPYLEYKKLVKF